MPANNLEVKQFKAGKSCFLIYRYKDDKNNNYEYQVYKLVPARTAAKELGAVESIPGRRSKLNTREMCDWLFKK